MSIVPPHIAEFCDRLEQTLAEDIEIAAVHDASPYRLRYPHELERLCCVKVAGGWSVFHRIDARGHLVLTEEGSAVEWTYEPTDGESFVVAEFF